MTFGQNKTLPDKTSETEASVSVQPIQHGLFLVHDGDLARTMPIFPQVTTYFLGSGWTPPRVGALKIAIQELVVRNPILSGVVLVKNGTIYIEPGHYNPESHSFWTDLVSEDPPRMGWKNEPAEAKIQFIEEYVAPLLPKAKNMGEEAKAKSPVFHVNLMALPEDHLFYSVQISHAVGDGATYYEILNQISQLLKEGPREFPQINWEAPAQKGAQETFQDHMSRRDKSRLYGAPFILGILPRAVMGTSRYSYLKLSQAKINQKKCELKSPNEAYLTTNDIIVAALSQSNNRLGLWAQLTNVRGKKNGVKELDGGNFVNENTFPRKAALDPNQVRQITRDGKYFEANQAPFLPALSGRVGRISNWSSVRKSLELEGTSTVVEVVPPAFVKDLPFDLAVIFSMDKEHLGILHNFKTIDTNSGLLKEILA